ncbi:MAG: YceD family protein [Thermomicrobiales bacterium]
MPGSAEQLTDTTINVVDYLKSDAMGRTRRYVLDLPSLDLDRDLVARAVHAEFRLLRVGAGVLAEGVVRAVVDVECVRTLDIFPQPVEAEFAEQFRPTIDITTGRAIEHADGPEDEPEIFPVGDNHEIDLREPLRQVILVALPMQPVKPGTEPVVLDETAPDDAANPFAVLEYLFRVRGKRGGYGRHETD